MKLLVEIDGQAVPIEDCDWVMWAPCGCAPGVLVARVAATEEDAWREFCPNKRERTHRQRDGYRLELVTHERWRSEIADLMRVKCPHEEAS